MITDLESLREHLQQNIRSNTLTLDASLLVEAGELARFIGWSSIELENAEVQGQQPDAVIITGRAKLLNNVIHESTLTARIDASSHVTLQLQGTPIVENWTFRNSLPQLPPSTRTEEVLLVQKESVFFDLSVAEPTFTLSTVAMPEIAIARGLNFNGQLRLEAPLATVQLLRSATNRLALAGTIDVSGVFPQIDLRANISDLQLSLGSTQMRDTQLRLQTLATTSGAAESAIILASTVVIGESGRPIILAANILQSNWIWTFDATLPDESFSLTQGLSELIVLTNGSASDFHLPESAALTSFYLTHVRFGLDLEAKQINFVSFAVKSPASWPTPISGFEIHDIIAGWTFHFVLDGGSGKAEAFIGGTLSIGTADPILIDVTAEWPDYIVSAELRPGQQISLTDLLNHFIGSVEPVDQGLIVDAIDIRADLKKKVYTVYAEIKDDWPILPGFTLSPVSFKLVSSTQVSGEIYAQFSIAGTQLYVRAEKPTSGAGWRFSGGSIGKASIPVGSLVADLAKKFSLSTSDGAPIFPKVLEGLVVTEITITFDTGDKRFSFTCSGALPLGANSSAAQISVAVQIDVVRVSNQYTFAFGGHLTVGALTFDLMFQRNYQKILLLAVYRHTDTTSRLKIRDLVSPLDAELAQNIPDSLEIDLKDVFLALSKDTAELRFLFGIDIGAKIGLSSLPLVGKEFPPEQSAGVDNLRLLVASADLKQTEVDAINAILPAGIAKIAPAAPSDQGAPPAGATVVLSKGATISAQLNFGGTPQTLSLPVVPSGAAAPATAATIVRPIPANPVGVTTSDTAKWFTLQKKFGPLELQRVGVQYKDAVLWFLLDAALSSAGLSLSLEGLALGSSISKFEPRFDLRGLGIAYRNEAVEISGAFLRNHIVPTVGSPYDEFAGAAVVKAKALTLSAIGSYAYVDGHPSLFVYAVLDYPLGGPSFFFVTGLAGGFGYNRALIVPPIDQIAQFPLVAMAVKSAPPAGANGTAPTSANPASRLTDTLNQLRAYIPASTGDYFLAVGIKFTSFKIIDSFVLLTVAFGHRLELNVLGLATVVTPPVIPGGEAVEPLAELQMALRASFIPDEGFLGVSAQLTPASYILSRACHLTGGFAFYSWFDGPYKGDFVLTLGGYHPNYKIPAHYPRVPRLGINWQVDAQLGIKGEAYFALTAAALMAGGQLQATWDSGDLKAWFQLGADLIISWKPYHYDAYAYASLRVSYTLETWFGTLPLDLDVSANLHLWGPEFSGTAHIKASVFERDISFGAAKPDLTPIDWATFKQSFLPPTADGGDNKPSPCCGVAIQGGLLRKIGEDVADLGIVNAKQLVLVTNSVIPSSAVTIHTALAVATLYCDANMNPAPFKLNGASMVQENTTHSRTIGAVGIAPMARRQVASTHTISIDYTGAGETEPNNVDKKFAYTPVLKNVPVALWGGALSPNLNGNQFVQDALSGFEIRPLKEAEPDDCVSASGWAYHTETVENAYHWEIPQPSVLPLDELGRQRIKDAIAQLIGGES